MALLFFVSEIFVLLFLHVFSCSVLLLPFFRKCVGVIIKINIHDQYVQLAPRLNSRLFLCVCWYVHDSSMRIMLYTRIGTYQGKAPMSNPLNLNRFDTTSIHYTYKTRDLADLPQACNKFLNKYPTQVLHFHIHPIYRTRRTRVSSGVLHYYIVLKRRKTIEEKHQKHVVCVCVYVYPIYVSTQVHVKIGTICDPLFKIHFILIDAI